MFDRDLNLEEKSVRGSLVTGLSKEDVRLLDIFEGNVSAASHFEKCRHKETLPRSNILDKWCLYTH